MKRRFLDQDGMNVSRSASLGMMLVLAYALVQSAAAVAQESTERGGKGLWYWTGTVAATNFSNGITLNVLFIRNYSGWGINAPRSTSNGF